jgi:hypothetical protein
MAKRLKTGVKLALGHSDAMADIDNLAWIITLRCKSVAIMR